MGNVATRLLSLILLLQSRASWKAAELAAELNVSERTVHRYMVMLEEMGIPIYSERGPIWRLFVGARATSYRR